MSQAYNDLQVKERTIFFLSPSNVEKQTDSQPVFVNVKCLKTHLKQRSSGIYRRSTVNHLPSISIESARERVDLFFLVAGSRMRARDSAAAAAHTHIHGSFRKWALNRICLCRTRARESVAFVRKVRQCFLRFCAECKFSRYNSPSQFFFPGKIRPLVNGGGHVCVDVAAALTPRNVLVSIENSAKGGILRSFWKILNFLGNWLAKCL